MARCIVITSGKGGVGKSSLSVCIGRELAHRGNSVVLVDTDAGLNNLDVIMDVENKIVYDVGDVLSAKCRLNQALVTDSVESNLYLLPSVRGYGHDVCVKKLISALSARFDYVFIDCPAGIDLGFHRAVEGASEAIVVTTPHLSAIKDASTVIRLLGDYKLKRISYILNRVRGDMVVSAQMADVEDVTDALGISPLGVVPDSDEVNGLSSVGDIISEQGEVKKAIGVLCDNIENNTSNIVDLTKKYRGILGAIRRLIKNKI